MKIVEKIVKSKETGFEPGIFLEFDSQLLFILVEKANKFPLQFLSKPIWMGSLIEAISINFESPPQTLYCEFVSWNTSCSTLFHIKVL